MIEPNIEQALAPTRRDWKTNVYQSKLFAFITSSWLAACIIGFLLAVVYVLLKIPPLAPQTEIMTIEPIAPTKQFVEPNKKVVKPAKAVENSSISKIDTVRKPKPPEPLTQFDRDLAEFQRKIP